MKAIFVIESELEGEELAQEMIWQVCSSACAALALPDEAVTSALVRCVALAIAKGSSKEYLPKNISSVKKEFEELTNSYHAAKCSSPHIN